MSGSEGLSGEVSGGVSGKRPWVVAVSGGIASGKSALTDRLSQRGVPVFDADQITRELSAPGGPALPAIVADFGSGILDAHGALDRRAMRQIVFNDPAARARLEAILHPLVRTEMRAKVSASTAPYCVVAIPLLVKANRYDWIDYVATVDAPDELRLARLVARDGIDNALAERMLAAQAPRAARLAAADEVISNTGSLDDLHAAADALHHQMLERATARQE